jgi:predicted enzyme related to lactoylglutathione lyase
MNNPVTWFSIPSDDIEATSRFYEQAFGWKLLPETIEDNDVFNYRVALNSPSNEEYVPDAQGRVNGCIVKRQTGIQHPVVLIEVADLAEAAAKIKRAGGSVVSDVIPMKSLNGAFFLARDTDGNVMEVFRSNT